MVLLHAGVADRTMWSEHLPPIAAAGYRAVAIDLPGFGEAVPVGESAPWSDVLQTMDALGVRRAVIVGNSFGGGVALSVAVTEPERVCALVLVSARPPGAQPSPELAAAWEAEQAAMESGDLDAAVEAVLDAWTLPGAPAALRDRVARMQRRAFELEANLESTGEGPDPVEADPAALARLAMPALVAAGEFDMPDFRVGAEQLTRQLCDARHVVIPEAGHLAPLEQPAAFRALLIDFLTELGHRLRGADGRSKPGARVLKRPPGAPEP